MPMSTLTFDQTFEALVGTSGGLIVLASFWIVSILIQIEKTKASAFSSVIDEDSENGGGGGGGDLHFEESTTGHIEMTDQPHLEVEKPEQAGSPKNNGSAPSSPTPRSPRRRHQQQKTSPQKSDGTSRRRRKVPWSFVWMQIASVGALVLLTYLLLVVSSAPIALRGLGSLVVFFIFLRFQIGEEIRRQRIDRIILLVSLFLVVASMLSLCVYSMKTLKQGEIYEGPARIVGYDMSNYNNTQHDPTTRTDIAVSWGKDWGCPLSGGKVCQSRIEGAMCQVHPEASQTKHKGGRRQRRKLEDELEEDLEEEEKSNQELESENENLEKENQELEEEIEELKEENEVEEEEVEKTEEEETSEIYEVEDEYGAEIMEMEEEEMEDEEKIEDQSYESDEKEKQEEMDQTNDPDEKEELEDEIQEDEQDEDLVNEEYEDYEEELEDYSEVYDEYADEDYEDAVEAEEEVEELEDQKDEIEEEVEQTESEIEKEKENTSNHGTSTSTSTTEEEDEAIVEEVEEAEEEEIIEAYEEGELSDDMWYWDEMPEGYDDDWYEDEYWNYDWDSVWGEYACEDLFDSDVGTRTYDPNTPAGGDDEWPFVYIYGSCKTCDAYVLDYFAEEAFEELEDYRKQAIIYMSGAIAGLIASFVSYIKYRVMPTAENEIELLGTEEGVLA